MVIIAFGVVKRYSATYLIGEVISRSAELLLIVPSHPDSRGMGLNFGMTLGRWRVRSAIFTTDWESSEFRHPAGDDRLHAAFHSAGMVVRKNSEYGQRAEMVTNYIIASS